MNENKVCFIIAVNDDEFYDECIMYINNLKVDSNVETEIITIRDSSSICSAYNKALGLSDAKYKVYLHQDVFIINKDFIKDILNIFKNNSEIGLMGVFGTKYIPSTGIWWETNQLFGCVYEDRGHGVNLLKYRDIDGPYIEVSGVDGLILITQYDLRWRDDIFDGWHYYDSSQCMEFKKHNYKVIIPNQITPWCIHYCGDVSTENFDKYRSIFINEYSDLLK